MYQKPKLQNYGSFSELTKSGYLGAGDGCIILDPATGAVVDANPGDGTFNVGLPRCGS